MMLTMLTVKVKVAGIIKNEKKTNLGTPWTILFQFNMLLTLLPGSQFTVMIRQKHKPTISALSALCHCGSHVVY